MTPGDHDALVVGAGAASGDAATPPVPPAAPLGRRSSRARRRVPPAVGLVPFLLFVAVFLLWPAATVFGRAAITDDGFSTTAMRTAMSGEYRGAFASSIRLSLVTSVLGGVVGTGLAYAIAVVSRPRWLRSVVTAWSGVAANFGGVPLAFAFIAALGAQGLVTKVLAAWGVDLVGAGFRISDFWGLVVIYLYFQVPLMLLVMAPAIDGLRPTWREAAEGLGASPWTYWRRVGLPILWPSALGGMLLLFANAFAAYATAYAVSSGNSNIVPLRIRFVLQGNVIAGEEDLGFALAAWMIAVMAAAVVANVVLQRRTARWLR